jgi:hypothetical protein
MAEDMDILFLQETKCAGDIIEDVFKDVGDSAILFIMTPMGWQGVFPFYGTL